VTVGKLSKATGLVDHPDGAQRIGRQVRNHRPQVLLERVAGVVPIPVCSDQELLEGPDSGSGGQGNRLDTLTRQVGQQPPAVRIKVARRPVLAEATPEPTQIHRERRPQLHDFLLRHR
jgi:hypothetical protein